MNDKMSFYAAHQHCSNNREEIKCSEMVGCFYCRKVFLAEEVDKWTYDGDAICPRCSVDAVIGDASGLPVRNDFFLKMMYIKYFDNK